MWGNGNRSGGETQEEMSQMDERMTRRDFLRTVGIAAGAAMMGETLSRAAYGQETGAQAKVVRAVRPDAFVDHELQAQVVTGAVDDVVATLTGQADADAAWSSLFEPDDVVGIKVNCLGAPGIYTRREVVDAIAAGVQRAGVSADNIIIWDRPEKHLLRLGDTYAIQTGPGVKCYASDTPEVGGYSEEIETYGGVETRQALILKERITALVNTPVLKHHGMAGVTIALKNHLGSVKNPSDFHPGHCVAVGDLNTAPTIVEKTRLIICDAMSATFDGNASFSGPQTLFEPRAVLASFNPVALDVVGREMIDAERAKRGLDPVGERAIHVDRAAELGLGPSSLDDIELVDT